MCKDATMHEEDEEEENTPLAHIKIHLYHWSSLVYPR